MCRTFSFRLLVFGGALLFLGRSDAALATEYANAVAAIDAQDWDRAIAILSEELEVHPGHTAARVLLGKTYESAERWEDAESVWDDVVRITRNDEERNLARRALILLRRQAAEREDIAAVERGIIEGAAFKESFKYELEEIDWDSVEEVESTDWDDQGRPPFHYASKHFDTYATNEKLAEVVGKRCEVYLEFMSNVLFGGRAWGFRVPVLVYPTHDEYVSVGGAPASSAGVTFGNRLHGRTSKVMIYHLTEIKEEGERGRGETVMYKYAIDGILPHELTHVMINEFFGGQDTPQWLHEAVAERMAQMRKHYLEAARLARAVVAGEHFRLRDLFEQEGYPSSRITLFYHQSAAVVTYLFEAGPEAMYTFLSALAEQKNHDQALSEALGIPEEGAVETFEKEWVEWMKRRYVMDLKPDPGEKVEVDLAEAIEASTFDPPVNEVGAFEAISDWRTVPTDSLSKHYCGVGATLDDWGAHGGSVHGRPPEDGFGGAYLGIRMYEKLPLAVRCTVRSEGDGWAGFALLDSSRNETGIEVLGRVSDGSTHELVALLGDELAIYVDGVCTGRYPRPQQNRLDAAIDFPLALVAYSPLEITKLEVAHIDKFDIAEPDEDEDNGNRGRGRGRSNSRGGRRPGRPPN
ncbi:MAG: tetratricopeptide repeat protein [Planctomycetes bacterium]|nr:tetratricopeptide repeat protein [Planctomycetota bacterium]